ncbi:MAG: fused DSP-PTPase phosphatase/NAD kinase-like protein [Clostridium sp.]
MKKFLSFMCVFLFVLNFSLSISCYDIHNDPPINVLKVIDNDSISSFPERFRDMTNINISGSKQFTPSQLLNIKNKYLNKNLIVVDLRQESHGFINNIAFCYYLKGIDLNHSLSTPEVMLKEKEQISKIHKGEQISLYRKSGIEALTTLVQTSYTELDLCKLNDLSYTRLAVVDGGLPTPEVLDSFLSFVNSIPQNSHIHFHCEEGEGRTTMFMVLYTILKSKPLPPLQEILDYQIELGGIKLTDDIHRAEFLENFYNYVKFGNAN